MAETTASKTGPKRHKWLRVLAWVSGILLVLILAGYFVCTSSGFLKAVVLPRVSDALNAEVTAEEIDLSPFKQVVLRGVKVQAEGHEPVFTAPRIEVRYGLFDILRGNYRVELIEVESPTIQLVKGPGETSNLDPILKAQEEEAPAQAEPAPTGPGEPMRLDIKKIVVSKGTLRRVELFEEDYRNIAEVTDLSVTVENVRNDFTGRMQAQGALSVRYSPPPPGTNGVVHGILGEAYSFSLTKDLEPVAIQGGSRLTVSQAGGAFASLADASATLDVVVTPVEVKEVALRFRKGETNLGTLLVTGPFDMRKLEGQLAVQLLGVDKNLLDLAGAPMGISFGPTTITSTNSVVLTNAGNLVTVAGDLNMAQFQVTQTDQTTPPLDLHADYNLTVDQPASQAVLRALSIVGTQNSRPLLKGSLSSPMPIAWGDTTNAIGDSTFTFALNGLNLADWKPFLGEVAPAGQASGTLRLVSKQAGQFLSFDAASEIQNLVVLVDTNRMEQLGVLLSATGQVANLEQVTVPKFEFGLRQENQALASASGSLRYDMATTNAQVQVAGRLMLAPLAKAMALEDMSLTGGGADYNLRIIQTNATQSLSGSFALTNLTGNLSGTEIRNYASVMDANLVMGPSVVQIRNLSGNVSQDGKAGGQFQLSGTYNLTNETAQLSARLTGFNENGLRPFLEPMLADRKLVSVAVNGLAEVETLPGGASVLQADMNVTNLVVTAAKSSKAEPPLEAGVRVTAALQKEVAEIRQAQLALTPTERATNVVAVTGRIDMSDTNAYEGSIRIHADALDLTRYYDLFAGETESATTQTAKAGGTQTTAPASSPVETEPEPMTLPVRDFKTEASINKLYLRELEITNLLASVQVGKTNVLIKPARLSINGAPVQGTVDLNTGVAGYGYYMDFSAAQVPFPPLVNSFMPERKGQLGGELTASGSLKGRGITEASLRKNLSGGFRMGVTNLNMSIGEIQSPLLRTVVNVIAVLPDLIKNRDSAAIGSLVGALFGGRPGTQTGGLVNELKGSPIEILAAQAAIGSGKLVLTESLVQSDAFQAMARGTVDLAPILTNSTVNIPLSVRLKRSLAEKINFVPAGTPTNVAYVAIPDYVSIQGTVGAPDPKFNYSALVGTALQQFGGKIPGVDEKTGNLIQGLGGILSGRRPPATTTNAPAAGTNAPAQPRSLLQGLGELLLAPATNAPASPQTNRPGTNAAPASQRPATDLLNQLLNPK